MLFDQKWRREPVLSPVGHILKRAANYIDEKGWLQNRQMDDTGAVCSVGAICKVTAVEWYNGRSYTDDEFTAALEKFESYLGMDIADWNDMKGRTKQQVIETLMRAADAC